MGLATCTYTPADIMSGDKSKVRHHACMQADLLRTPASYLSVVTLSTNTFV